MAKNTGKTLKEKEVKTELKTLFVCAANASRSPCAEFVFNLKAGERLAESAGLQPSDEIDARMALALRREYVASAGDAVERFLFEFKPRLASKRLLNAFERVYAMDDYILGLIRKDCPRAELFPPNGVKDPAAIYPSASGDVFLDCLNEIENGVKIILTREPTANQSTF